MTEQEAWVRAEQVAVHLSNPHNVLVIGFDYAYIPFCGMCCRVDTI